MTPYKKKRLWYLSLLAMGVSGLVLIILMTVQDHLLFFVTPTDLIEKEIDTAQSFRLGGMVVAGSIKRSPKSPKVVFEITDNNKVLTVHYDGIVPDLFREGQGVIAEGKLTEPTIFTARSLLAKHDENYMPREVYESLRKMHEEPQP